MKIRIIRIPQQLSAGTYGGYLDAMNRTNDTLFALGGDLQSHGGDFTNGLTQVNAGNSHEENPYEGVQLGVDEEGTPNLVEEGETIYNDYVFSNRILVDDTVKEKFHLSKKKDISYAEVSKKLEKEASERPNDPISKAALDRQMADLADAQEAQKARMEAEEAKKAFDALSPEEKVAVMRQAVEQEATNEAIEEEAAEEAAMQEQSAEPQSVEEIAPEAVPEETLQQAEVPVEQPAVPEEVVQEPEVRADGGEINTFKEGGKPKHKWEGWRYAGLFGPLAGLTMMTSGIGKPDYSGINHAVGIGNQGVALAGYQPISSYLRYRPMDIWSGMNRLNANAKATDRAILNNAMPMGAKMAGMIANWYNNQIADGNLFKDALEYNDALREKVASYNRDTQKYNADAYRLTSAANAEMRNKDKQYRANLAMQAAKQKMDADASWYNSLYGNVDNLFAGISDLGRENAQWNTVADMAADGIFGNLGTSNVGNKVITYKKSKGGKLGRKRGLTC